MLSAILQHTPRWVWALLAVLIVLGVAQSFPRRRTLRRAIAAPIMMIAWSLSSVALGFSQTPATLAAWAVGVAGALAVSNAVGAWGNILWLAPERRLIVPGSWVPLLLIMGLFATKFGVGVLLAMRPDLARDGLFAMMVGFAYGTFSGIFLGRGVAMWHAARRPVVPSGAH